MELVTSEEQATVLSVEERPTVRQKPLPLNTVQMQMLASKYLSLGSDITMKYAEELYNEVRCIHLLRERGTLSFI